MALKEAPGLIPAMDMNTGQAILFLDKIKEMDALTAPKIGSQLIGGEMAYHIMNKLYNDIGIENMPKIIDVQKGGTDVPEFIRRQLEMGSRNGYEAFIGSPLGSGHNPDATTDKEWGSTEAFIKYCQKYDMTPIIVLHMTQPGASHYLKEGADEELAKISYDLGVRHFVAPATKPHIIEKMRKHIGEESEIFSTGVGKQKTGDPLKDLEEAVYAGADQIISGRALYQSKDPLDTAKQMFDVMYKAFCDRKGL